MSINIDFFFPASLSFVMKMVAKAAMMGSLTSWLQ